MKIVVGNNFDDIVLDESKDVLLEVSYSYAISWAITITHAIKFATLFETDLCSLVWALPSSRANL